MLMGWFGTTYLNLLIMIGHTILNLFIFMFQFQNEKKYPSSTLKFLITNKN
jgi:hypothetical protein